MSHDSQRNVRKFAESDPGAVDKIDRPTTKVRKCIFTEDNKDEIDVLVLSKQLGDMEKVANDEDGHLNYIKMKLKYLQRKINIHQLKLITNTSSSVTEETENIFDTDVEEALELVTTVRKIVSNRRKRMETHKWKLGQTEIFLMRQDNEELIHFSVKLCDTVEKNNEIARGLKKNIDVDDAVCFCEEKTNVYDTARGHVVNKASISFTAPTTTFPALHSYPMAETGVLTGQFNSSS